MNKRQAATKPNLQLAAMYHQERSYAQAQRIYEILLEEDPNNGVVLNLLGLLFLETRKYDRAVSYYDKALRHVAANADTLYNLGLAHAHLDQIDAAIESLQQALDHQPTHHSAHYMLAKALYKRQEYDAAIDHLQQSNQLNPRVDIYVELAANYLAKQDWDKAVEFGMQALEIDPKCELALHKVATGITGHNSELETANVTDINQVLKLTELMRQINPKSWLAHLAAGEALQLVGETKLAINHFRTTLLYKPDLSLARTYLGILQLTAGDLQEGWSNVNERGHFGREIFGMDTDAIDRCSKPLWQGEIHPGMRLLVASEQGIGDQILQSQMICELIEQGVEVILTCTGKLVSILRRSIPQASIYPKEVALSADILDNVDYKATLLCLGKHMRSNFSQFNEKRAYLKPATSLVDGFAEKYQALNAPLKVGIAWKSHSNTAGDAKSTDLSQWLPLLRLPGIQFFSIQYGEIEDDIQRIKQQHGIDIFVDKDFDPYDDIEHAAAQIANMDLVISVSNAAVHLAASMNVPTWVLVGRQPLWHWFLDREDSVWYESVKLYRQANYGNWNHVIADIYDDLIAACETKRIETQQLCQEVR